jgi:hypothetical protein
MPSIRLLAMRSLVPVMGFGTGGSATWLTRGDGADMLLDTDTGAVTIRRVDGGTIHDLAKCIVVAPAGVGWYAPEDEQPASRNIHQHGGKR